MQDLAGRVAVVTGAASGIGRGMAEALAAEGMKVVLADVEAAALEATAQELRAAGGTVRTVWTDVSRPDQVEALARETVEAFGGVHVLCNNAGVATGGVPTWESTLDDWQWILGVNLMGVVHGIRSFVPRMLEVGDEGHVVNTASMAGLVSGGGNALYGVTKHAVVSLSESVHNELVMRGGKIRVSVLCPGWVNTHIDDSERNRPVELADTRGLPGTPEFQMLHKVFLEQLHAGLEPRRVGDIVVEAIRARRFYVLTHDWQDMIRNRMENILEDRDPTPVMPPGMESIVARVLRGETSEET